MYRDVEDTLTRELHQVAEGLEIPALPELPQDPPSRVPWQPLLVAAVVLLIALGAVATLVDLDPGRSIRPAPSPSPTEATRALVTSAPTIPYLLGDRLYIGGARVPGSWGSVAGVDAGWMGIRRDGSYWWGNGAEPQRLNGAMNQPPVISPDGSILARLVGVSGWGQLIAQETGPDGDRTLGPVVDVLDDDGASTFLGAVTNDGLIVASGQGISRMWRPLGDSAVVDLTKNAPDQHVRQSTPAGVVVVDGSDGSRGTDSGDVYLADLDETGTLTRTASLPNFAALEASAGWIAWVAPGVAEGEVITLEELQVQRIDGSDAGVLTPPDGWLFGNGGWAWENDETLVVPVVRADDEPGVVRCSPVTQECVVLDTP